MNPPILVTGTDTGVGKTIASAYLLRDLRHSGIDCAYLKPVQTGLNTEDPADADVVRQLCGAETPVCTSISLAAPAAPNVAARLESASIDLERIDKDRLRLQRMVHQLVIEGAGGILVPVTDKISYLDLAKQWQARVLVVVADRLGCRNHAALTVAALRQADVEVGGWILNRLVAVENDNNLKELTRQFGPPLTIMPAGFPESANYLGDSR